MKLSKEQIKEIIEHREPILLVDEVIDMKEEEWIVGKFTPSIDMDIFKGHFPGNPVLPGVYSVECMAQVSDVLILSMDRYRGKVPYFIGIDKVKFMRKIDPDMELTIKSKIEKERKDKGIVTCFAEIFDGEENLMAEGYVTLAMR